MNGKMTELHASLGLASLSHIDDVIKKRRSDYEIYFDLLKDYNGIRFQKYREDEYNYSYI